MLHVGHAAEDGQNHIRGACEAEGPGCDAALGVLLLEAGGDAVGDVGQTAAEQGLHDDGGNAALAELAVEVLGVDVAGGCVVPVEVVELDLDEVPVDVIVHGQHFVEDLLLSVEGPAEVADAAGFTLLYEEVQHAVVDVSLVEVLHGLADGVQQVIVDVVCLQVDERLAVHGHRTLAAWISEVGELGGDVVGVPGVAFEGYAGGVLGEAAQICRGGVEIVDTVLDGVIHQCVYHFLVNLLVLSLGSFFHRPAHAAVTEQGDAVSVDIAVGHLAFGNLNGGVTVLVRSASGGQYGGRSSSAGYLQEVSP